MPTASGRETAQEKRDRQHAARWAKIDAAVAALPEGWAAAEAADILAIEAARVANGGEWFRPTERGYPTEVEAIAVSRAMGDRGSPSISHVFDLRYGGPTTYRVRARSDMPR